MIIVDRHTGVKGKPRQEMRTEGSAFEGSYLSDP